MKSITKNKMYLILIFSLILAFVLCQSSLVWAEAKKVVKIGFIDPLTGPTADIGIGAKK